MVKILGFDIFPFSNLLALPSFDPLKNQPLTFQQPIVPQLQGIKPLIQASTKCLVVAMVVYLTNTLYPVQQEMEEA